MSRKTPEAIRLAVFERDGYRCAYCDAPLARPTDLVELPPLTEVGGWCGCGKAPRCSGCPATRPSLAPPPGMEVPTVDHVIARANGGTDELDNLVAACGPCNDAKGTR